jgi:hypothetical protein
MPNPQTTPKVILPPPPPQASQPSEQALL